MTRHCTVCGSPLSRYNGATVCFHHPSHPHRQAEVASGIPPHRPLGAGLFTDSGGEKAVFSPPQFVIQALDMGSLDRYFEIDPSDRLGMVGVRDDV